jgi:hypothetical protein
MLFVASLSITRNNGLEITGYVTAFWAEGSNHVRTILAKKTANYGESQLGGDRQNHPTVIRWDLVSLTESACDCLEAL